MTRSFSDREKEFIDTQGVLRFNSHTPDGEIHSVPVCFGFDGTSFYLYRPDGDAKRWQNVQKNNKVSVELDSYAPDWSENAGILVYGRASFLESGERQRKGLSLLKERYATKYRGLQESTAMVEVRPTKIVSWFVVHNAKDR